MDVVNKTILGEYLSSRRRLYLTDSCSRRVCEKVREFEDWGISYYKFLRKLNEFESKLLFKYYGTKIQPNEFYDLLFKDKIFAYEIQTLTSHDLKFSSVEQEEDYFIDVMEKVKSEYFESKTDKFIAKFFKFSNKALSLGEGEKFPTQKIYFYTLFLSLFLYLITELIVYSFNDTLSFLPFQRILWLASLLAIIVRYLQTQLRRKNILTKNNITSRVANYLLWIFVLPAYINLFSPFILISYLVVWYKLSVKR